MHVAADIDVQPTLTEVRELARDHSVVPLRHTFISDTETPESAYLRLGEVPVEDPDWDVGIEEPLVLPSATGMGAYGTGGVDIDPHVMLSYDRIPMGEVEIRRASSVTSADGHHLGHVDGFVRDSELQIAHLVLEHGPLRHD